MEKIAIISDIHSNITAFKTVLDDIHNRGIKRIFCAGDLVLRGSSPCEVVDIARKECEIFDNVEDKMKLFEDEHGIVPDIVLYGDIHIQYMQKFFNKTLINVGSVGNVVENVNHDENIKDMSETTQAYYTILEGDFGKKQRSSFSIQFVRLPYDINKEIEIAKQNGSPSLENYIYMYLIQLVVMEKN